MPPDPSVLGFTNPWYGAALENTRPVEIADGLEIRVPAPPVLLATKLAAHEDRGADDPMTSTDLEDVIALLANRPELVAAFLPETRRVPGLRSMVVDRVTQLREGVG